MVSIMNNINLGVDIVLVDRINKILNSKAKSRFLNKIFSRSEISDSKNRQNQSEYFSGRFAAKEAIKKALSSYDETDMLSFKSLRTFVRYSFSSNPSTNSVFTPASSKLNKIAFN